MNINFAFFRITLYVLRIFIIVCIFQNSRLLIEYSEFAKICNQNGFLCGILKYIGILQYSENLNKNRLQIFLYHPVDLYHFTKN